MIADFGVSRLLVESMTLAGTNSLKGSIRWMAVELVDSQDSASAAHQFHTKASDVWAFGMVLYVSISTLPSLTYARHSFLAT